MGGVYKLNSPDRSRSRTWKLISERYFFPGGYSYVAKKTKACVACAYKRGKSWPVAMPKLQAIPVQPKAMWRIHQGNSL